MPNWFSAVGQGLGQAVKDISTLATEQRNREMIEQQISSSKTQQALHEQELAQKKREFEYDNESVNYRMSPAYLNSPEAVQKIIDQQAPVIFGTDENGFAPRYKMRKGLEEVGKQYELLGNVKTAYAVSFQDEIAKLTDKASKLPEGSAERMKLEEQIEATRIRAGSINGEIEKVLKAIDEERTNKATQRRLDEELTFKREKAAREEKLFPLEQREKEASITAKKASAERDRAAARYDDARVKWGPDNQPNKQPPIVTAKEHKAMEDMVDIDMKEWKGLTSDKEIDRRSFIRSKIDSLNPYESAGRLVGKYMRKEHDSIVNITNRAKVAPDKALYDKFSSNLFTGDFITADTKQGKAKIPIIKHSISIPRTNEQIKQYVDAVLDEFYGGAK